MDRARWVLGVGGPVRLEAGTLESLSILGGAPRPVNASASMLSLSDWWSLRTRAQLEAKLEEWLAATGDESAYGCVQASACAQLGYAAYLLPREDAWAFLVRAALKAQREHSDFRALAEAYRREAEEYLDDDDEDERAAMESAIATMLGDPQSPWVDLPFDLPLKGAPLPTESVRTWTVGRRSIRTLGEALAQASDGDRIVIEEGTYREKVRVSTPSWDADEEGNPVRHPSVELVGKGRVILAHDEGPVILVADGGLVLEGIRVQNDRAVLEDTRSSDADCVVTLDGFVRLVSCELGSTLGRGLDICDSAQVVESGLETFGMPAALVKRLLVMERSAGVGSGVVAVEDGEVTLDDCSFVGGKHSGLEASERASVIATRCTFRSHAMSGVAVFGKGKARLEHCVLRENTIAGLAVVGGDASAIDCQLLDNKEMGATFEGKVTGNLTRVEIRGNGSAALGLQKKASVTVVQSRINSHEDGGGVIITDANGYFGSTTITGSDVHALEVYGKSSPTFHGCTFHGKGGEGALVARGATPRFNRCAFEGGERSGVYIEDGSVRLSHCSLRKNKFAGVALEKGSATVLHCDIHGNGMFALQVGAPLTARDCKLHDNVEDGVYVHAGGRATLERCDVADNGDCNVRLFGGVAKLTECTLHGARSSGVFCEKSTKVELDACDVFENGEEGIHLFDSSSAKVQRSHLHDNAAPSLLVQKTARATVTDSALDDVRADDRARVTLEKSSVRRGVERSDGARVTIRGGSVGKAAAFKLPVPKRPAARREADD